MLLTACFSEDSEPKSTKISSDARTEPASQEPNKLATSEKASADKLKYANDVCKGYKAQVEAKVICGAINEPGTYGDIASLGKIFVNKKPLDFEWFKKINGLPASITQDMSAPTHTMYVITYRRER